MFYCDWCNSTYWIIIIVVEVTCQHYNGGCDQDCDETETGVNCSCYDGYQLIDNQNCTGNYNVLKCASKIYLNYGLKCIVYIRTIYNKPL